MSTRPTPRVTEREKALMARMNAGLEEMENDDEGSAEWRAGVVQWMNDRRQASCIAPLKEWWERKSEPELHERAKSQRLLRDVR